MNYKMVQVTQRGGPQGMVVVEEELQAPGAGQVRVRIQATPVCQDDIAARVGNRPTPPRVPFVPGYAIIGVVDACGEGVDGWAVGDPVAALTQYGGYAEYITLPAEKLVPVPAGLEPAVAAPLILNYLVAYQILHRVAQVKAGDKVLIIGASGGVGSAFLQLGRLAGIKMYGLASPAKWKLLQEYGATPIDYHTQDFVQALHELEPEGIDFVFNGMGEETLKRGLAVLRRGGVLVHYGGPQSMARLLLLVVKLIGYNLLPNGKTIRGYGTHTLGIEQMKPDWQALFGLLAEGKIRPVISARFPILEARRANELLESGQISGNIVLLAADQLSGAAA